MATFPKKLPPDLVPLPHPNESTRGNHSVDLQSNEVHTALDVTSVSVASIPIDEQGPRSLSAVRESPNSAAVRLVDPNSDLGGCSQGVRDSSILLKGIGP